VRLIGILFWGPEMRWITRIRLFGYFFFTAIVFMAVFLPEFFLVYLLMISTHDFLLWVSIALSLPILYLISTIFFGIIHSQIVCKGFLPQISPGRYIHGSDEAMLFGVAIVSPGIFKSMLKAFSFIPHIYSMFLGKLLSLYGLKAGNNVYLSAGTMIDSHLVTIGDNSFIGLRAIIAAHVTENRYLTVAPVKIGKGVTIGGNTIIAPGAEIGDDAIIGVNSLVKKGQKIPSKTVYGGTPARYIRDVNKELDEENL
jgi:acetyltransferase-like isoleucine patch superfamily enzyme